MKIKGNSYLFGRCLKIVFCKQVVVTDEDGNPVIQDGRKVINDIEVYKIEHAPEVDRRLNVAIDVNVIDKPSALSKRNPGFQATVTIYNPWRDLLNKINDYATWVNTYVDQNSGKSETEKQNAIDQYYESRLTCTISAGFIDDTGKPMYTPLIKGYVNGSSLARKGLEDVLTFGVMSVDFMRESRIVEKELIKYANVEDEEYDLITMSEAERETKFERTWYETLVKYIKQFEMVRISDPQTDPEKTRNIKYFTSTQSQQTGAPTWTDVSRMTEEDRPLTPISTWDRDNSNWFDIQFVKSLSIWKRDNSKFGRDWQTFDPLNEDADLKIDLSMQIMPQNKGIYGSNLAEMLDGLCAQAMYRVGWYRELDNRKRNTYVIYRLGAEPLWVQGEQAGIQIWNYQNLLESPSVSGAGIMTVKMVFNPLCKCGITLALMLDKNLISGDNATRKLTDIEAQTTSGRLYGSMSSNSNLATFGNVQISGSNAVAATNKQAQDVKTRGYMFNLGFPIIEVKHELSTHSKNWTTTVKTVPCTAGLTFKQIKEAKGVK